MRCSYCSLACQFDVDTDDIGIIGINYQKGRLCARGCANEILLKDGRRLSYPILENLSARWNDAIMKVAEAIRRYKGKIGITVGAEVTIDEFELIKGLSQTLGAKIYPFNLEGGFGFSYRLEGVEPGSVTELRKVSRLVTISDVFSVGPVLAKEILDFRLRKETRHYHIDSLPSRVHHFADETFSLNTGDEVRSLIDFARENPVIKDLRDHPGLIIASANPGRFTDPIGYSLAVQYLARTIKAKIIFIAPNLGWPGDGNLDELFALIKKGDIKLVLNFGDEIFNFRERIKGVRLITTSSFKVETRRNWVILPVPVNCEKKGRIPGIDGDITIEGTTPPSGVYPIEKIISLLGEELKISIKPAMVRREVFVDEAFLHDRITGSKSKTGKDRFLLFGFSNPLNFRDLYDYPIILLVNPRDLVRLRLSDYNETDVSSRDYRVEVMVRRNSMIPEGTVAIATDSLRTWRLFNITGGFLTPSEVRIWKGRST
ncbi:MAG TPA: hypothetical protein EYP24_01210 [bacterium (Candidatus Stahlbacteria)]|nr:hypothetical protein [Candidatus Stahlbacteria bacterium]